ncbi:hypothetical protein GCM10018772_38540 [Streptomyces fumanus]|uniref:Uncharacterized protein n=1 Tax=Streptomyces fumanus TaxID=67302 RepID=A0A919AJ53_9ACTN|nr:hypothetical protein GCM10018772_38540 [Streptomyces fumanus]
MSEITGLPGNPTSVCRARRDRASFGHIDRAKETRNGPLREKCAEMARNLARPRAVTGRNWARRGVRADYMDSGAAR